MGCPPSQVHTEADMKFSFGIHEPKKWNITGRGASPKSYYSTYPCPSLDVCCHKLTMGIREISSLQPATTIPQMIPCYYHGPCLIFLKDMMSPIFIPKLQLLQAAQRVNEVLFFVYKENYLQKDFPSHPNFQSV